MSSVEARGSAREQSQAPLAARRRGLGRFLWWTLLLLGCGPEEVEELSTLVVKALYPVNSESGLTTAMRQGLLEAHVGADFEFEEYTPESDDEARELLDAALAPQQGRRLIITAGEVYAKALDARECALNGAMVLELESQTAPCASLRSVELQTFPPAFLAGVLALSAESLAPRRMAGVIAATPTDEVAALIDGFAAGTEYVGGQTQTLEVPSLDPSELDNPDEVRAEIQALAEAVDVLMVAGDANSELVLDGVHAHNDAHPGQLLRIIGVDQDFSVLDTEVTLGSVVREYHQEVRDSILAATVDAFSAGQIVRGFSDDQTQLITNPVYAETELGSVPFPGCEACATLEDAVREAVPAALEAAAQAE